MLASQNTFEFQHSQHSPSSPAAAAARAQPRETWPGDPASASATHRASGARTHVVRYDAGSLRVVRPRCRVCSKASAISGWVDTRPIQSAVIRLALAGSDLIACAETGTGKTCAFVVPIAAATADRASPHQGGRGLPQRQEPRAGPGADARARRADRRRNPRARVPHDDHERRRLRRRRDGRSRNAPSAPASTSSSPRRAD